jgi:hypothetical protein
MLSGIPVLSEVVVSRWGSRRAWLAIAAGVMIVGVAGITLGSIAAHVPPDAGSTIVMAATLQGSPAPDPSAEADPGASVTPPSGSGCTDVDRAAGSLHLCWVAYRTVADADPQADYYEIKLRGTVSAGSGSGIRWLAVSAHLDGTPANGVFDGWPSGTIEGSCSEQPVDLMVPTQDREIVCGRTTAVTGHDPFSHTVTWNCEQCLLPTTDAVGIVLYEAVAVPEGTLPGWQIGADLGS